ncbi:MAG: hypothetical protein AAF433_09985 [Bacteroidota bacterium]
MKTLNKAVMSKRRNLNTIPPSNISLESPSNLSGPLKDAQVGFTIPHIKEILKRHLGFDHSAIQAPNYSDYRLLGWIVRIYSINKIKDFKIKLLLGKVSLPTSSIDLKVFDPAQTDPDIDRDFWWNFQPISISPKLIVQTGRGPIKKATNIFNLTNDGANFSGRSLNEPNNPNKPPIITSNIEPGFDLIENEDLNANQIDGFQNWIEEILVPRQDLAWLYYLLCNPQLPYEDIFFSGAKVNFGSMVNTKHQTERKNKWNEIGYDPSYCFTLKAEPIQPPFAAPFGIQNTSPNHSTTTNTSNVQSDIPEPMIPGSILAIPCPPYWIINKEIMGTALKTFPEIDPNDEQNLVLIGESLKQIKPNHRKATSISEQIASLKLKVRTFTT